jgi:hypothetical protein
MASSFFPSRKSSGSSPRLPRSHPLREVVVEVLVARAHAADVEREVPLTGMRAFSTSSLMITLTIATTSKFARLLPSPAFAKPSFR